MPVEKLYMVAAGAVRFETDEAKGVEGVEGLKMADGMLFGPFWRFVGTPEENTTDGEQVRTRLAVNELIALVDEHEQEHHDGEICNDSRVGMLAFVMHSLGVTVTHVEDVLDLIANYDEHHDHGDGEHPHDHPH